MPRSEPTTSEWLTRPELSEELKIPVSTLAQWAWQGKGPRFFKLGQHVRYRRADVDAFIASSPSGGDPAPGFDSLAAEQRSGAAS